MDSVRHDLREALDELQLETIQMTVVSAAEEQIYGWICQRLHAVR